MKIINKIEFKKLMEKYPDGGIVFSDFDRPDDIHVTDGDFGATVMRPYDGEVFDYDWNIMEYEDNDKFLIFDNNDVLQMIQTLVSRLKINLICDGDETELSEE